MKKLELAAAGERARIHQIVNKINEIVDEINSSEKESEQHEDEIGAKRLIEEAAVFKDRMETTKRTIKLKIKEILDRHLLGANTSHETSLKRTADAIGEIKEFLEIY